MPRHSLFFNIPSPLLLCASLAVAQSNTIYVTVSDQVDLSAGINGRLQLAMSTNLQLIDYSAQFFNQTPQALSVLNGLQPQHTRVQLVPAADPLTSPGVWDFSQLDAFLPAVQSSGDHSPEFQIAGAPSFMNDADGNLEASHYSDFASMSANLVRYYNSGGFNVGNSHFQSPGPYPITWWGIFNEPNGAGLSPQDYVSLYNTMVPAMAQVDPSIKFVAIELSDWVPDAETFLPTFVSGVTAPVNALATHFYSTCKKISVDFV